VSEVALARSLGAVVSGVSGHLVQVEVDHSRGLPTVGLVGLPDASVIESKHRAKTAIVNSGLMWPKGRVTISLSPAELRKHGAGLDLAIALGILGATGQIAPELIHSTVFLGELGLDGSLRSVPGALPCVIAAAQAGIHSVIVPYGNLPQCRIVPTASAVACSDLNHVLSFLRGESEPLSLGATTEPDSVETVDLSDVVGQEEARWALEVAAVGRHNLSMIGSPGVGKTLLAQRIAGILPPLTENETLQATAIHAVARTLTSDSPVTRPPFEAPHHSATMAALVGSVHGHRVTPGALTRAHHGVLFLDEAPEFSRNALEALRQPLESGHIALSRSTWTGLLPARFQLILAANPCPCGNALTDTPKVCRCASAALRKYTMQVSGPLRDRIDINILIPSIRGSTTGESSAAVRERVVAARQLAAQRFADFPWSTNSEVSPASLRVDFYPEPGGTELLNSFVGRSGGLMGSHRVLRVAWSLADLAGNRRPTREDVALAIHLRNSEMAMAS
jgi:magnesium chelatase family protein